MSEAYARALHAAQLLELFAEENADSLPTNIQLVIESCTCELRRLKKENESLRLILAGIACADYREWDEEKSSPDEFVRWAKSQAKDAIASVTKGGAA